MGLTVEPVLAASNLTVHLGAGRSKRRILRDVSLEVAPGETVGIIGETGSGKTTLARTILGLTAATSGKLLVCGTDMRRLGRSARRRFRRRGVVQYVFQNPLLSLDPDVPVGASVAEPLRIRGGVGSAELSETVGDAFLSVNLSADLADRLPAQLSGGQRQRVAIARALISDPKLLILDEPVSALDAANRVQVLGLLKELRGKSMTVLFISHDLGSVAGLADRIAVLYRGEIVESGPTVSVVNEPEHPYTKLLIGSAPTLTSGPMPQTERQRLKDLVDAGIAPAG